jgi:glycosyl-4,4'-diaponeurosporenoate acyltransferase
VDDGSRSPNPERDRASVPPLRLPPIANVAVDIVAWAFFHSATGYAVHRIPVRRLRRDNWLLRPRRFEADGALYERLRIRRWKDALPEAGALFAGGMSKRRLPALDVGSLERFAYGVIVNVPFIAIQRYNRQRVGRALARSSRSRPPSSDSG